MHKERKSCRLGTRRRSFRSNARLSPEVLTHNVCGDDSALTTLASRSILPTSCSLRERRRANVAVLESRKYDTARRGACAPMQMQSNRVRRSSINSAAAAAAAGCGGRHKSVARAETRVFVQTKAPASSLAPPLCPAPASGASRAETSPQAVALTPKSWRPATGAAAAQHNLV